MLHLTTDKTNEFLLQKKFRGMQEGEGATGGAPAGYKQSPSGGFGGRSRPTATKRT